MDRWYARSPQKLELDIPLALENGNDTAKSIIQHMGPNDVNVGLGFHMAPSGMLKPEIDFRKSQSDSLASQLGESHWAIEGTAFPCRR